MNNQKGQLILTLILVMATALVIGLSVIQRSLTDVSTSTKVEQSSRAFSAAEAGIEQYFGNTTNCTPETCKVEFSDIGSKAAVEGGSWLPYITASGVMQSPLEYADLAKEEVAQVWLADPDADLPTCGDPFACYKQPTLDVFWGTPDTTDKAALEITLVYYESGSLKSRKWYLDNNSAGRSSNGFKQVNCTNLAEPSINPNSKKYQCKVTLGDASDAGGDLLPATGMMLLRVRLLYNSNSHPFTVQGTGHCGLNCDLPPQVKILISSGSSGETQRKVKLFQVRKVVPPFFDYAIFSAGEISK